MEVSLVASSSISTIAPEVSFFEQVDRMHANLISLPEELCAASRPSSPSSEARSAVWQNQLVDALKLAAGDTTHPKWGYVSRITKLACTSRRYVGVEPGTRVGEGRNVKVDEKFNWVLPDTEEEWARCEQEWKRAAGSSTKKPRSKSKLKDARTSKYWPKPANDQPEPPISPGPVYMPTKAELVRAKIERWQAEIAVEGDDLSAPQALADASASPEVDKRKAQVKSTAPVPSGEKVQVSLGFRVVKRASVTDAKGGRSAAPKPKPTSPARSPTAPVQRPASNHDVRSNVEASSPGKADNAPMAPENNQPPQIAEVPELSFLPPSFPSQLKTSTPPPNFKRHKPPPIAPCSPPPSSPLSLHSPSSFDPTHPQPNHGPSASSSPPLSPVRRSLKRPRTPDSSADGAMDISLQSPRLKAPPPKKAREDPVLEQAPPSSGPHPVPPSTPPPTTSPVDAPVTPVSRRKGLGNAKGLPVPTTPDPHPLPTLTELLASSRRSKPRPRPPSRKQTPQSQDAHKARRAGDRGMEGETELPIVEEDEREPSPTKTYFSSPASGSSDSGSVVQRSPVSPLFTQNPGAFMPASVSSQRPSANDDDPFLGGRRQSQSQGPLRRGSSGFFGMGYNSQFDVEGQVDRVSELLERDVDYSGWLRNLDDVDEEMPPTQSQGAVEVGH
ncbi:hypothetical protein BN946_scf184940.g85 [Trametes cinnabarina]|uniref:Uncharacterized protein n=1 Tax=Pycnoporus cinnabarinus TaxID=5643 RepID=A0A060SHN8_PYCCI|nr:hypothetical protein BN946_scf184940.g85 [Trametes cinnabarina]